MILLIKFRNQSPCRFAPTHCFHSTLFWSFHHCRVTEGLLCLHYVFLSKWGPYLSETEHCICALAHYPSLNKCRVLQLALDRLLRCGERPGNCLLKTFIFVGGGWGGVGVRYGRGEKGGGKRGGGRREGGGMTPWGGTPWEDRCSSCTTILIVYDWVARFWATSPKGRPFLAICGGVLLKEKPSVDMEIQLEILHGILPRWYRLRGKRDYNIIRVLLDVGIFFRQENIDLLRTPQSVS